MSTIVIHNKLVAENGKVTRHPDVCTQCAKHYIIQDGVQKLCRLRKAILTLDAGNPVVTECPYFSPKPKEKELF
jgi:6-phosphogluconate dehydrogenase